MIADVLLDHVSAYATAVRRHLSDLSPEQVEDLTDGLEADLAEALEDPHGPVATGEIPIGRLAASGVAGVPEGGEASSVIDLSRRFGPAAEYAAELRAAAGLGPARPGYRPAVRSRARGVITELRVRGHELAEPVLSTAAGRKALDLVVSLRPLWWVLRGWLWYSILLHVLGYSFHASRFVPRHGGTWLLLAVLLLVSINLGRGMGRERRWVRRAFVVLNLLAVVAAPGLTTAFRHEVERAVAQGGYPVYVDNTVYVEDPAGDGVWVEGQQVSNLFVYDADGNPLDGVQIFDDRGRQVRTTTDESWDAWSLPGVTEPWSFAPVQDAYGRARWNVYPLKGAPFDLWDQAEDGARELLDGPLRTPPAPFAKAPAVVVAGAADAADDARARRTDGDAPARVDDGEATEAPAGDAEPDVTSGEATVP
ncbi:hypothetical protein [Actinotalea sp. K2]|uniref:hypothetical protein n=1 Tax=Actinotalea sp. K2 TaxID=2939438 RepID=UPI0020170642|nr:hypothetical protein [Actinotalea sp. K2]MCL3861311.1 hypothetical protein [Actinotalea sp. K2]